MALNLISHGTKHLRVASDEGHLFKFLVTAEAGGRQLSCEKVKWAGSQCESSRSLAIAHAKAYARVCAEDIGLL